MFDEIGIEGIEIEDNIPLTAEETKGMFIDILPELPPDEGVAFVSFYLDDSQDVAGILERVEEGLNDLSMFTDLGERTITESETEDKDWINNWKQYFKPFTVDDILIKPTWEEIPEEHKDKLLIQIDPGTAFGTGQHETTQLCIRQLRKYVTPETVLLDVGTGSGILGITALKLGANTVFGTDLDENAITAVGENLEANGISGESFTVLQGNIIDDKAVQDAAGYEKYDICLLYTSCGATPDEEREHQGNRIPCDLQGWKLSCHSGQGPAGHAGRPARFLLYSDRYYRAQKGR